MIWIARRYPNLVWPPPYPNSERWAIHHAVPLHPDLHTDYVCHAGGSPSAFDLEGDEYVVDIRAGDAAAE